MKKLLLLGLVAFIVFLGCSFFARDFYLGEEDFPDDFTGTVVLILDGSAIPTKTIEPVSVTMDVDHYDLSLVFPSDTNENLYPVVAGTDVAYAKNGLKKGSWELTILAKDVADHTIGAINGVATTPYTFDVEAGVSKIIADLLILPITGDGDLSLDLVWPPAAISGTPTVDAYLVAAQDIDAYNTAVQSAGDLTPYLLKNTTNSGFSVNVGAGTAAYGDYVDADPLGNIGTDELEPNGYYGLFIILNHGSGTQALGVAETVRIIAGHESHGDINLTVEAGGVDLTWETDLQNPVEISFTPPDTPAVTLGVDPYPTQIALQATLVLPTPESNFYTFQWYLDGAAITATGGSGTVDKGTLIVPYTIAIGDFSSDGFHHLSLLVTGTTALSGGTVESLSSEVFSFAVDVVE